MAADTRSTRLARSAATTAAGGDFAARLMLRRRARTARAIARRDFRALARSPSGLLALSVALAAASLGVRSVLEEVAEAGLATRASPLYFPLFLATLVLSISHAVWSSASVARERESGTLEVLFYGPVDEIGYVLGKWGAQVLGYLAICPLLAAAFGAYAWSTNLRFSADLVVGIVLSAVAVSCASAFGLLLSALCASVRGAMLLLVGVAGILLAVQGGSWVLAGLPERSGALEVAAEMLGAANRIASLVSPYSYFDRGMEAALVGDATALAAAAATSIAYTATLLAGSAWALGQRGPRRVADGR